MQKLITYLFENIILDFQGDLSLDAVRDFLEGDQSDAARALLSKLSSDGGVNDMMIVLADCLQECIPKGITPEVIGEQVKLYAES